MSLSLHFLSPIQLRKGVIEWLRWALVIQPRSNHHTWVKDWNVQSNFVRQVGGEMQRMGGCRVGRADNCHCQLSQDCVVREHLPVNYILRTKMLPVSTAGILLNLFSSPTPIVAISSLWEPYNYEEIITGLIQYQNWNAVCFIWNLKQLKLTEMISKMLYLVLSFFFFFPPFLSLLFPSILPFFFPSFVTLSSRSRPPKRN